MLLAEAVGKPYPAIIQERILDPLGMTASVPAITHETRRRLAVGYTPLYDDRPYRPSDPLVPATWLETDTGDGSIAATAGDLAAYLRMLLNRGQGPHDRLLSAESFALMTTPVIEDEPGSAYGYGLSLREIDGHACIGHGGGMVGYHSALLGDQDDGLGVVVLVNGPPHRLNETARFALACLRAANRDEAPPPLPPAPDPTRIGNAADYAGTYRDDARVLKFVADGSRLVLECGGSRLMLESAGEDCFLVDHPDFALFPLRFGRDGGRVVEATHGPDWYRGERYDGPTSFDAPAEWSAYVGHYRAHNPWLLQLPRRLAARAAGVDLVPGGEEEPLAPLGGGDLPAGRRRPLAGAGAVRHGPRTGGRCAPTSAAATTTGSSRRSRRARSFGPLRRRCWGRRLLDREAVAARMPVEVLIVAMEFSHPETLRRCKVDCVGRFAPRSDNEGFADKLPCGASDGNREGDNLNGGISPQAIQRRLDSGIESPEPSFDFLECDLRNREC